MEMLVKEFGKIIKEKGSLFTEIQEGVKLNRLTIMEN